MEQQTFTRRPGVVLGGQNSMYSTVGFPAVNKSWNTKMGGLWGGFKLFGGVPAELAGKGTFSIDSAGKIELTTRYDPPGSVWWAFLAAILSYIVFAIMVFRSGFGGAIGWVPWYIIITLVRRQDKIIELQNSDNIIVDASRRRMAFLTDFEGKKQWLAFELKDNFNEALQSLRMLRPAGITESVINRRVKPIAVLGIIALVIIGLFLLLLLSVLFSVAGRR